ncbi:MAG: hypothetical protein F7C07_00290 [Desulfurococcales archaeon]|nr:hypothetical protein [Desulfurococcales archaeon]
MKGRGIAEVTGVILMGLVTLAIATIIFVAVVGQMSEIGGELEDAALEAMVAPKERPVILAAKYNSSAGSVWVSIASSSYPVRIVDVYINGAVATTSCTMTVASNTQQLPASLPGETAAVISCPAPTGLSRVEVRIAYEGITQGLVVAYAS